MQIKVTAKAGEPTKAKVPYSTEPVELVFTLEDERNSFSEMVRLPTMAVEGILHPLDISNKKVIEVRYEIITDLYGLSPEDLVTIEMMVSPSETF